GYPEGRLNSRDQPRFDMARNTLIRDYCLPPPSWPSKKTNKQKTMQRRRVCYACGLGVSIFKFMAGFTWMNSHRRAPQGPREVLNYLCALRWLTVFIHLKTDIENDPASKS